MYITTREMVISIICNACGVLGLILWAIEAHKSNANQRTQSVESVENNGDIIVRSNLEPFRVDEPQLEVKGSKRLLKGKDEPTCEECKHFNEEALTYMKQCKYYFMECRFEPKGKPQTERSE